ncbi:HAD-IB family hydrolase [Kribbella jiaozuonensis]|uniref:HAD-IB family hydrolase n=1 Tax=Kribbella jiaozuonensis TaxID=2575441 RepID=A0A4U3LVY6_9ACTN|nr:HAD-IB family hydrolase [Kribbella jiaozuonensis]TKK79709.1 HAD-IB family hydrolase [Kribbella jiaozuonensis]
MSLADKLKDKKVLVTGVTGFVGEALLHRIIGDLPGTTVAAIIRPKGSLTGADRMAQLLRKDIFKPFYGEGTEYADAEALSAARIHVIDGDLSDVPELPKDLDIVVHCAGDVSFDPPIHEAFTTNVLGTKSLLERIDESRQGTDRRIHYVHISTAYTAGRRRGAIPEASVEHLVDWRTEAEAGMAMKARIEEQSRSAPMLAKFRKEAEKLHRRAGHLTAAADTERRRIEWVAKKLVETGTERARSLGWTDCYTFTKALGERVVEEFAGKLPTSIVRPAIIESALQSPHPGWIEGFKMAEPLILAYGRGELPEFPASPDSVIEIIPVDHVVGAICAVMATEPELNKPEYYHIGSGARNPLTFEQLYAGVRAYFSKHPFDLGERGAVRLPVWKFPGGDSVETMLRYGEKAHKIADRIITTVPRSERVRKYARELDVQKRRLDFLRRYMDLYSEYAQAELQFIDDNVLALHNALEGDDKEKFACDTAVVDWQYYLQELHCPSVTESMRRLDVVRKKRNKALAESAGVLKKVEPSSESKVIAAFDMDGTLLSSNVIETYLWMRLPELDGPQRVGEIGAMLRKLPKLIAAERKDRGTFLRTIYRRYAGADLEELNQIVDEILAEHVLERLSGAAVRRIREHRAAGHKTILITGAVRPLTRPLEPLFDEIVAAELAVDDRGRCTGFLSGPPLVGESRAAWIKHHARQTNIDLSKSYAYADSHSDLPMLETVGNPVAVSPDVSLFRAARAARWQIVDWKTPSTSSRLELPGVNAR